MSTLNLNEFKRTTIGHYIDHCNQSIDAMTRDVFSQSENPAKEKLVKIFQECMKQLGDFLSLSPDKRTKDAPFPKFAVRICLRNNPSILKQLEELKLTLAGETDCDFPLPPIRIDENGLPQPLSIQDQQEIQNAICLGVAKKVSSLKKELCETRKSVEEDAKAAALAKAEILKSENKRKADEMHSILIKASTREGAFELVRENPMHLKYLKALRDDFDIVELAIKKEPKSFQFASPRLQNNPALIKLMLQQENSDPILEFISQVTMKNKEAVLKLIKWNELALCHAEEDLYDLDFLLEALLENPMCYQLLNESLRKDKKIFDLFMKLIPIENFQENQLLLVLPEEFHDLARAYFSLIDAPVVWESLPANIKNDRGLIAFYYDQYFDEDYKSSLFHQDATAFEDSDCRNFLATIPESQQNFARSLFGLDLVSGYNYDQVEENLKDDLHVLEHTLKSFPESYDLIPEKFKDSDFYIKLFLKNDPDIYRYLPENKKKIPSIARIALSKDLTLFASVPHPLNENADFIIEIIEEEAFEDDNDLAYTFLQALPPSLRSNPLVILSAIDHIDLFYENLNEAEQNTKAYAMAVMKAHGEKSYEFLPEAFKSHPDIILHAVKAKCHENRWIGFFIPTHLTKNKEFLFSLIEADPAIILFVEADEAFNDEDFVYKVIQSFPIALQYIDPRFFKTSEKLEAYFLQCAPKNQKKALSDYIRQAINKKHLDADFISTVLKNHDDLAIEILKNKNIHYDLKKENSVSLGLFRRFFFQHPERFAFFAQQDKSVFGMNEELLLDLIGHDVKFFRVIHKSYKNSKFLVEAIKKNGDVYDRYFSQAGKKNPIYKAARALSVPYYRPLS